MNIGDTVAYKKSFLQSIGCLTGELPFARGTVQSIKELGNSDTKLASIDWNSPNVPKTVNIKNLVLKKHIAVDSAL